MGVGLGNAYGIEAGFQALHDIIARRKKDEILAAKMEDDRRQQELQMAQFEEQKRQFGITNTRLEEAAGIVQQRQHEQDLINRGARVESSSAIRDPLSMVDAGTLIQTGRGNEVTRTPIQNALPGVGIIEKIGARPTVTQGPDSGSGFEYGGTSQQVHQAEADKRAEEARVEAAARDERNAAHQGVVEDQANRRIDIATQLANRPIQVGYIDADGNLVPAGGPPLPPGGRLSPNPQTAIQRNLQSSRKNAGSTVKAINDLSEKINVNQGVMAKITGYGERAKAQANLNDDIAEYESLVQGFTPLVARAVGHSGVLTEQDVASVRQLFPKATDSKSLRDRKVARLNAFFAQASGEEAPDTTPQATPEDFTVVGVRKK